MFSQLIMMITMRMHSFSGGDIDPDMMVDSLGFWGLFGGMMLGVVVVAVIIGICLAIFVVASITDWFDGHLARKNNLVTNFGKFMDPLADKLLVCSALICMIELDRLPAWFVIIIIAREFIISGFRLIAAENGVVIAANYWGKFKTASQMVMIILLILNFGGVFEILTQIFVRASLALTVISLITYIVQNKNVITFTLDKPQYLSVEFNGDRLHNLHLFANPMETETYSKEEKGVMYFGPGVHRPKDLPNNQIRIPGNTTVYLAPGAVVKRSCCWIKWRMYGSLGVAFWTILFVVSKSLILKI